MKKRINVISVMKALLVSYLLTGILLLLLTLCVLKLEWDESKITGGIVATYVLSTFLGGFLLGKRKRHQKFLWGLGLGALYFLLLFAISFCVYRSFEGNGTGAGAAFFLCAAGGMLGGMLS